MTSPVRHTQYVVDASVAVKLFVEESLSDTAHAFFECMANDPGMRLFVPDLFYLECANIFWKYVNRFNLTHALAKKYLAGLADLSLTSVERAVILDHAFDLALTHGISVYDACYVATGRVVNAPLITADERLVQKFLAQKDWVGSLASFKNF